ncbi:MAG: hypothetical protein HN742_16525 [Lentisphaerae bacterium]|nr:hypothetical protein [Lentisphaerota bacterium]MBT7843485.1 hypothetical protein [Lentisphaerota bacterium]
MDNLLEGLASPIVLAGDDTHAYRDPTAVYHEGVLHFYSTLVRTEEEAKLYWYTIHTSSADLQRWSAPTPITPRGQHLNYSSPGSVVRVGNEWVMCLQTYPIPGHAIDRPLCWANNNARLFLMRSSDLVHWDEPELLKVKGVGVAVEDMGRMIDPYLVEDKDESGKWWCFYKQNGASYSCSHDLNAWTYSGRTDSGENVCVLIEDDEYVMFHSPENGIGTMRSADLVNWRDAGFTTLGQHDWPWAETRLTAGFVLDLRRVPEFGAYVMLFHGSGPGREKTTWNICTNCHIGIAWSSDLTTWDWPGGE